MTAVEIQERLAVLTKHAEQLKADAIAVDGAIQDCKYWLDVVNSKVAKPDEGDST